MADHEIVWTHDRDSVTAEVVCNNEDCLHRYVCQVGDCEMYFDVRREPSGAVTHAQWDDEDRPIIQRHRMNRSGDCNFELFLNADRGVIAEMADEAQPFEIGRTAIAPVWQGDDGALWKRAEA